jgi:hypothetical protein
MSFPQSRETQRASRGCAPGTPAGARPRSVALRSPAIVFFLGRSPHSLPEANRFWRLAESDRSHCATGLLPFAPHSLRTAAVVRC